MTDFNVSIGLINSLVERKNEKKFKRIKFIYNFLKLLGIAGSIAALIYFGVTLTFGIISSSIMACLLSVYSECLVPARRDMEEENVEKMEFCIKLQHLLDSQVLKGEADSCEIIRGKNLKLFRVGLVNSRKTVTFKETIISDGKVEEDNSDPHEFLGEGYESAIFVVSDGVIDRNINRYRTIAYLAAVREYVLAKKSLNGDGYMMVPECSNSYIGALDKSEVDNLPGSIKKKVKEITTVQQERKKSKK